ncbi:xylose isomerase domain-containing protein [Candidatus Magnetoovum chiemensis]|nr:xylose isomerase domain-containing protein [Candidatus Magnetoovum chiemensis]
MKLSVSNILWGNAASEPYLELLAREGCYGVEIAPSLFWQEPVESTYKERNDWRKKIESYGLKVVSFHALLFTRQDLKIFASKDIRQKTEDYLYQTALVAMDMGCPLMVLGSPKNRAKGDLNHKDAKKIGIDLFSTLANRLHSTGIILCIEPLSRSEADFIVNSSEGLEIVKEVNHRNFRLMLDAKSMHLENEKYDEKTKECRDYIEHVHVNDPGNSPLESKGVNHKELGQALKNIGYNKVVSLEVGRGFGEPENVILDCLYKMRKYYQP